MDETLKPCPAECLHTVDRGGPSLFRRRGDIFGVYCQTCQCSTEYYSTEAEAITAWNTRADAAPTPKADEVEAVARAIEDQLTAEDGWMVGTPALSSMCHDFALAAIAALDAARGKAEPVAWMYSNGNRSHVHAARLKSSGAFYYGDGWTETPLYKLEGFR